MEMGAGRRGGEGRTRSCEPWQGCCSARLPLAARGRASPCSFRILIGAKINLSVVETCLHLML